MTPSKYSTNICYKKISSINLHRIINKKNPFVVLSRTIDWDYLQKIFNEFYNFKMGRPRINIRLMIALHYLKYTFNLSDRQTLARCVENIYWQIFSGMDFLVCELPIHYSSMSKWRKRIGGKVLKNLSNKLYKLI